MNKNKIVSKSKALNIRKTFRTPIKKRLGYFSNKGKLVYLFRVKKGKRLKKKVNKKKVKRRYFVDT